MHHKVDGEQHNVNLFMPLCIIWCTCYGWSVYQFIHSNWNKSVWCKVCWFQHFYIYTVWIEV